MNIQFTDDELYHLFLVVDSRCRTIEPDDQAPWLRSLREKLLPVYSARHAPTSPQETP